MATGAHADPTPLDCKAPNSWHGTASGIAVVLYGPATATITVSQFDDYVDSKRAEIGDGATTVEFPGIDATRVRAILVKTDGTDALPTKCLVVGGA